MRPETAVDEASGKYLLSRVSDEGEDVELYSLDVFHSIALLVSDFEYTFSSLFDFTSKKILGMVFVKNI
jgi:hypothetical protein